MQRAAALLLAAALLAAFPPCLAARAEAPGLTVVYTEWFPYTFTENGAARGFEIDILREVLQGMGRKAEFVGFPWKRCLASLAEGQADALVSLLLTPERAEYTLYPEEHISTSRTVLFTAADKAVPFAGDLAHLQGLKIGVILGFSYGEAFDNAEFLDKEPAVDVNILINRVVSGRNDLAAENQAVAMASAARLGVRDKLRFLEPPIHTQKLYVGFSKARGHERLAAEFSRALAAFKASPRYREILRAYGVAD
ncbi:MAG: transporter substrate-binding domain-containing protein [Thermodesulfobacteriota bacterium]